LKYFFMKLIIYTDGGARNNPGPAGCGAVFFTTDNKKIKEFSRFLGKATNNQAEYQGVILALEKAKTLKATEIDFYLDSKLTVEQLSGNYKVKNKDLASLFVKVWNLSQSFKKIKYFYIPREKNKLADKLVNEAIDENIKGLSKL